MDIGTQTRAVEVQIADGMAVIALNRPERLNAVAPALVDDLLIALNTVAHAHAGVRAIVLTGNGRAFCAGHDLKEPPAPGDSRRRLERIQDVTRRIRALPQPVIAAVHGYAIGAGAEFALGCDLVLAADDAVFAFPESGLGLSVTGGVSRLLPLLVGPLKAKELLLFGEQVDATAALHMGLVNAVVPRAELLDAAQSWAARIAASPPYAVALSKRVVDAGVHGSLDAAFELEVAHALVTDRAADAAESAARFQARGSA